MDIAVVGKDAGLIEREEEQLLRRCDEYISSIVMRDRTTYTLSVLGNEGFLPGYGAYEGGVTASARRGFARQSGPRAFDLSRNNVVALREFVPGNRLYANRGTFYVARYHLGADEAARRGDRDAADDDRRRGAQAQGRRGLLAHG
jgi:hypothetical protein